MEIALVALSPRPVHRHVGDHPARHQLLGDKGLNQRPPLREIELMRQRHQQLTRGHGVLALLSLFGGVPQRLPVAESRRRIGRRHDGRELDVALRAEVELHGQALVDQAVARAIGGGRHGGPTGRPLNRLHL